MKLSFRCAYETIVILVVVVSYDVAVLIWSCIHCTVHRNIVYRPAQKTGTNIFVRLNFTKYEPIFKLFRCQNQEKICNDAVTKDPTTSQVCRYTTL